MADKSKIEWTDATWNPITGCSRVSAGCVHCYAEHLAATRLKFHPSRKGLTNRRGRWNGEVRLNEQWLDQPMRWKRPQRIFVCAHSDLFYDKIPEAWIDKVFAVMAMSPQHIFQVLTKRPKRMLTYLVQFDEDEAIERVAHQAVEIADSPCAAGIIEDATMIRLPNVWCGVSAENQESFEERYRYLKDVPTAVRWLSLEPLLGPINVRISLPECECGDYRHHHPDDGPCVFNSRRDLAHGFTDCRKFRPMWPAVDWVVVGGESGPGYRPMDHDWARSLRDQCSIAQVPFFMKQVAGKRPIPADLMVRQWPGGMAHG